MRVQSLGWEDMLEEGIAIHSRILAWRTPWTEELAGSIGLKRVGHDWATNTFVQIFESVLKGSVFFHQTLVS